MLGKLYSSREVKVTKQRTQSIKESIYRKKLKRVLSELDTKSEIYRKSLLE